MKSNVQKVDSHEISQAEYDEIPELPDVNLDLSREEIVRFVREGRNRE